MDVPKNHFEGKKSGYYFIKHINFKGGKSTNYESTPIKVILSDQEPEPTGGPTPAKGNILKISLYYSLLLILIIF